MIMSAAEICAEYRQAKFPLKQIGILADENGCTRGEIVEVLRADGEELPGQYNRGKTQEPAPEPAQEAPVIRDVYRLAVESIAELLEMADTNELDYQRFPERVRGVLMMLWKSGEQG